MVADGLSVGGGGADEIRLKADETPGPLNVWSLTRLFVLMIDSVQRTTTFLTRNFDGLGGATAFLRLWIGIAAVVGLPCRR